MDPRSSSRRLAGRHRVAPPPPRASMRRRGGRRVERRRASPTCEDGPGGSPGGLMTRAELGAELGAGHECCRSVVPLSVHMVSQ